MFKSLNIYSGSSDGLAAALTNPTELSFRKRKIVNHYPVTDKTGRVWADAEAAYKAYKTGNLNRDKAIMTRIIVCKLQQHPRLTRTITKRGGVAWLETCSHIVGVRNSRWEGKGKASNFIACLIDAYIIVMRSC